MKKHSSYRNRINKLHCKLTMLNITPEDNMLVNYFKDEHRLSSTDFLTLLLWTYANTDSEQIKAYVKQLEEMANEQVTA